MNLSISSFKSFVITFLAIYALGIVGFFVGSELIIRRIALKHDTFEIYKQQFHRAVAKTAAFGDSHVADGLISDERIANLGYPGETLPAMLAKAEVYVKSRQATRVILQLSPEQFAIYRADRQDTALLDELFTTHQPWLQFLRPQFRSYLLAYWSATLKNFPGLLGETKPAEKPPTPYPDRPVAERRKEAEIRAQLHMPLSGGVLVSRLFEQLARTLDRFHEQGVTACIVEYPVSSDYRAATSNLPTFDEIRQRFQKLASVRHLRLVDLVDALPDRAFGSTDHIGRSYRPQATALVLSRCFGDR